MVDPDAQTLVVELYILGRAPSSETALANLKRICDRYVRQKPFSLEIIDVLEHPQAAEDARVTATPTLVKRAPAPVAYVVGDLSATEVVVRALGLDDDDDDDDAGSDQRKQQQQNRDHRENR
jgi:circadian clock protein KaiB